MARASVCALCVMLLAVAGAQPTPPKPSFPQQYSAGFEEYISLDTGDQLVLEGHFYFDYVNNVSRIDTTMFGQMSSMYWNLSAGVEYALSLVNGVVYCQQETVPPWVSPSEINDNLTYAGLHDYFDIPCNVWEFGATVEGAIMSGSVWLTVDGNTLVAETITSTSTPTSPGFNASLNLWNVQGSLPSAEFFVPPATCTQGVAAKAAPGGTAKPNHARRWVHRALRWAA